MVEKKNNPPQNRAIFLAFIPPVIVLLAALYSIPVVRKTIVEALLSLPSLPWQTIMMEGVRILFSLLVYSAVLYASFSAMAAYNALRHWRLTGKETRRISVWMSVCLIITILGLARKTWEARNGSIADIIAVYLCFLTVFVMPYLPAGRGDEWVEHNLEDLKAYAERIPMLKIELRLWEELSEENAVKEF